MSDDIDKQQLYGDFRDEQARRGKLMHKAAHKALDIPEDDMQINANKTTHVNGIGTKGLVAIAATLGVPAALLGLALLLKGPAADVQAPAPVPVKIDKSGAEVKPAPAATKSDSRPKYEYEAVYQQKQADGSWKEIKREPLNTGG